MSMVVVCYKVWPLLRVNQLYINFTYILIYLSPQAFKMASNMMSVGSEIDVGIVYSPVRVSLTG